MSETIDTSNPAAHDPAIAAAADAELGKSSPSTTAQKIDDALDRIAALETAVAPLVTPVISEETGISLATLAATQKLIVDALAEIKIFIPR
jgi:hypothetical protein